MKIFTRYFSKEFIRIFLLCQILFITIYIFTDFLQRIDNFIEADVSWMVIFRYFLNKIPLVIVQMIPPATLIAVILMCCLMKKRNEITAMKASGLNILKICQPIIMISCFLVLISFFLSEMIVPYASTRANEIWHVEVEKHDQTRFYGNSQIWYRASNAIYWIRHFDNEKKVMKNPSFFFFDRDFRLKMRIEAERGVWEKDRWRLEDGLIQRAKGDGNYGLTRFKEYILNIPETPQSFIRSEKSPDEMNYWQIKDYAKRVREEGYDDTRYLVDMQIKFSFPLISLVLTCIGIPIALNLKKGGAPLAVTLGMGVCFLYLLVLGLSRSLGLSGVLPPFLSAWMANLLFFLFAGYLIMRVER